LALSFEFAGLIFCMFCGVTTDLSRTGGVSLNGFWANVSTKTPKVGDLVSCRCPLPIEGRIHQARLVRRVARVGHNGSAVQLARVDERGAPGTFEDHVAALSADE